MAQKDDVLEMLDSLEESAKKPRKSTEGAKKKTGKSDKDADIMGFLDSLSKHPKSGRSTPKPDEADGPYSDGSVSVKTGEDDVQGSNNALKAESEPPKGSEESQPKGSGDESQQTDVQVPDPIASLSSWWSKNKDGLWNTATSAVRQAEARVRDLSVQASTSANSSLLRDTLNSVIETIAPPISRHEQLRVNIVHDMVGYPSIEPIVYSVFERVMQQVEGGRQLTTVVQKGKERVRRGSDVSPDRNLNIFKGDLDQATKLAQANLDEVKTRVKTEDKKEHDKHEGESDDKDDKDDKDDTDNKTTSKGRDPVISTSNVYLSIQAGSSETAATSAIAPGGNTFYFVVHLADFDNDIAYTTVSQAFPYQWAQWLEASEDAFNQLSADPREWVIDWIEEGLALAVSTVAQSYVTKRMGVDTIFAVKQAVSN